MEVHRHQRILLDHSTGVLRAGELYYPVKFVLDSIGQPIVCVSPAAVEAGECVLFVPEETPDSLQLLAQLDAIDPESAEADRWRIYHGRIEQQIPARLAVESGKLEPDVFDSTELLLRNPLADAEPRVCRWMNRERAEALHRLCRAYADMDVQDPLMVGIDPAGLDIRARFGIVRLPSPVIMPTEPDARATIERMIKYAETKIRP